MNKARAIEILSNARRLECRDHAFGDREVSWTTFEGDPDDGVPPESIVGDGYFGTGCPGYVTVYEPGAYVKSFEGIELADDEKYSAEGSEAYALSKLAKSTSIGRNDSTGPDTYVDGQCMPGLTLAGVHAELTGGK